MKNRYTLLHWHDRVYVYVLIHHCYDAESMGKGKSVA